jgi:hypothetical protein
MRLNRGINWAGAMTVAVAVAVTLCLPACAPTGNEAGGNNDQSERDRIAELGIAPELQGEWRSTCYDSERFGVGIAAATNLAILKNEAVQTSNVYSVGDCSGSPDVQVVHRGTYRKGEAVRNLVFAIDIRTDNIRVRPLTQLGAKLLVQANWCGFAGWEVGVERDVTLRTGQLERCFPKAPSTRYDIFTVESGVDGERLYFGSLGDATFPARRPSELDRRESFRRAR